MNDAVSFTTQRSNDGSPGEFSITLTARKYKNGTWADIINPMDYIEISCGSKNNEQIHFRGFVDNAIQSYTANQQGGPNRSVIVNGRDYIKLFLMNQVKYIWTTDPSAAINMNWGLTQNYHIPFNITTADQFTQAIAEYVFDPFIALYKGETKIKIPTPLWDTLIPNQYYFPEVVVQPYTGSFWNLYTYFNSPPLGESFVYDNVDAPHVVMRVAPLKNIHGQIISPAIEPELERINYPSSLISDISVGKSDNQVYNYFFVYSDTNPIYGITQYPYVSNGSNPLINYGSMKRFGFRPLIVDSPWVTPFPQGAQINLPSNGRQLASALCKYLYDAYAYNENFLQGSITCHGSNLFIPGRYIYLTDEHQEYYIETVQQSFDFKGSDTPTWQAQLGITRGTYKSGDFT